MNEKPKVMSAAQYNAFRETELEMTYEQLAQATGRSFSIIARRCRGELPIALESELAVRYLLAQKRANGKKK